MNQQQFQKQKGAGLLEVLLAVIILSIGFLAAAKMQMASMRSSQHAYFLSQANFMIRDMSDRMRANPAGADSGDYDNASTSNESINPTCYANYSRCAPNLIAQADLHAWRSLIHPPADAVEFKPVLPTHEDVIPEGTIIRDPATDIYTIQVTWAENVNGSSELQTLAYKFTQ